MYRKILVTTDGSTLANKAVKSAIELASTLDAELIALKVIPRYLQTYFEGSIPLDNQQIMMLEKQWEDEAAEVLAKVEKQAEKSGLILTSSIVKANIISEAIITFAQKKKVDLIVMASHGRNGFKRLILGSETLQVLTHSHVPVLVLR
jgi:nucleotide-binding universal stress UspA family protein